MKYIRTRDGIYERDKVDFGKQILISVAPKGTDEYKKLLVIDYTENEMILGYAIKNYCDTHHINCKDFMVFHNFKKEVIDNENILKQADTIEELCDELVVVQKDFHDLLNADTHCLQSLRKYYEINKIEVSIYGAIYTDKGLIYVAKMNDKGELILLWQSKNIW